MVLRSLLIGLLPACIEYEYSNFEGVDVFYQDPAADVDILLVVDNSCSMDPFQQELSENFEEFISFFSEANVDYHIGVVTTSVIPPEPVPQNDCDAADVAAIPEPGYLVGDVWITPETPDGEELFSELVNLGICGSGSEMGLEAAYLALTDEGALRNNQGFLREEASLSIIFVANEEDYSPQPVNDYINAYRDVKGQRDRDVMNASALVVEDLSTCSAAVRRSGASDGTRYLDVAEQTNGAIGDICAEDFEPLVTELSLTSSRLTDTFLLTELPAVGSIRVWLDDEEIPCDAGQWVYALLEDAGEELPAVVFEREHIPSSGTQVTIRYNFGDGNPDDFCTDGQGSGE